jgi:inhibitor of cysteine peptidase
MKKLPLILLAVLILALALTAYIGRNPSVVKLDEGDAGKTIQLTTGDHLEVTLEGNPTTGYTWEVVSGQELLEQLEDVEFVAASQQMVGSSGKMRFEFKAVSVGEGALQLIYQRPFERDVEPEQTFSVQVNVK